MIRFANSFLMPSPTARQPLVPHSHVYVFLTELGVSQTAPTIRTKWGSVRVDPEAHGERDGEAGRMRIGSGGGDDGDGDKNLTAPLTSDDQPFPPQT